VEKKTIITSKQKLKKKTIKIIREKKPLSRSIKTILFSFQSIKYEMMK
jgi:hypothetical protein